MNGVHLEKVYRFEVQENPPQYHNTQFHAEEPNKSLLYIKKANSSWRGKSYENTLPDDSQTDKDDQEGMEWRDATLLGRRKNTESCDVWELILWSIYKVFLPVSELCQAGNTEHKESTTTMYSWDLGNTIPEKAYHNKESLRYYKSSVIQPAVSREPNEKGCF